MATVQEPSARADAREGPTPKRMPHPTAAERAAKGKSAREEAPRTAHGEWEPARDRRDPVDLLEEQAESRVPELVPIRYGRMLVSPFTFYRGAAYPMAADLADVPRTGLHVQLCGDAHLSNFGAFAAADRRLVFSINDFDETLPARSSGTSNGSSRASPWPAAIGASTPSSGSRSIARSRVPTGKRSGTSPACRTSTSGTHASTWTTSARSWITAAGSSDSSSSAT